MLISSLDEIAQELVILPGVAPAAVIGAAFRCATGSAFELGLGAAFARGRFPGTAFSFFDLASVSKPFLATSAARLAKRGRLALEEPLAEFLPEAAGSPTGDLPLELLLAHRGGLEAHKNLFAPLLAECPVSKREACAVACNARRPECVEPMPSSGYPPVYSDLGYLLVGFALERRERLPLDEIVRREVCAPLALDIGSVRALRAEHADFQARCAPTETIPFRGGELRGVVHDENAWAVSGHGSSGHAGLFGTAEAVLRFGCALLDAWHGRREEWLSAANLEPLVRERPLGTLRAGFDGKSTEQSSAGKLAGSRTFGHLGFTGTSLWCDPDADRVAIMLTNRVCPSRENTRIRGARPAVHDALFSWAGAGSSGF